MTASIYEARIAINQGNPSRAVMLLQEILTNDPENAHAHAYMSLCLLIQNKRYGCLEEAKRALNLAPELAMAHAVHAAALTKLDDLPAAKKALAKALELDPYDINALELKCGVALAYNHVTELKDAAEKLLEKEPDNHDAKYYLSRAYSISGKAQKAEQLAREALALSVNDPHNHEALGWALLQQKRVEEARSAALTALRLDPLNKRAHLLFAYVKSTINPVIGIVHRCGIWARFLSEKKVLILLAIVLGLVSVLVDATRFLGYENLSLGLICAFAAMIGVFHLSNFYVQRVVEKELATVRLRPDY